MTRPASSFFFDCSYYYWLLLLLVATAERVQAFLPVPHLYQQRRQTTRHTVDPPSTLLLHVVRDFGSVRVVGWDRNHTDDLFADVGSRSRIDEVDVVVDEENNDDDNDDGLAASQWRRSLSFSEIVLEQPTKPPPQPTSPSSDAQFVAETDLPTSLGLFRMRGYAVPGNPVLEPCLIYAAHRPLDMPNTDHDAGVPVRIHDQCLTSEVFGSLRCDCSEQLLLSLEYIQQHGGCVIYLQQEGRGIGLANKIAAYALQDVGFDTVDANIHLGFAEDCREYTTIPSILDDVGIDRVQLLTNNPRKVQHLTALGIDVTGTLPLVVPSTTPHNYQYMATKVERMHHANLASLLLQPTRLPEESSSSSSKTQPRNGHMAPLLDGNQPSNHVTNNDDTAVVDGVQAAADGYCFGRQSVTDAITAMAKGELIVVVDDLDRENEGDFIMAADLCTAADMGQIVKYSSGVVCIALEEERLRALELPAMVTDNQDPKGTAFAVTVDATKAHGVTTGISATDRATTMRLLADPNSQAADFHRPGHVLPLRARPGGVLTRNGHTEAAVDLAKLAGRAPAGVLCELVSEEDPTEMMRLPEIRRFCQRTGYVLTSIADLQQYRRETQR